MKNILFSQLNHFLRIFKWTLSHDAALSLLKFETQAFKVKFSKTIKIELDVYVKACFEKSSM